MFIIYVFFAFLFLNFLWEVLRTLAARSAVKAPVAVVAKNKNDRKVVTLAQAKPELKDYELLQARDRICKKNGIRGIDVVNYEAVLVKTSSGWITTIQRRHV